MFKKLAVVCAAIGAWFALSSAPAAADTGQFAGQWINQDGSTSGITRIAVSPPGGPLRVEVWGRCHPSDCDWGTVVARAYATAGSHDPDMITAEYNVGGAHRLLIMRLAGGGMSYEVITDFNGRPGGYYEDGSMRRFGWHGGGGGWPPGGGNGWPQGGGGNGWPQGGHGGGGGSVMGAEDCVSFNPGNVQVVNNHGNFTLMDGQHAIVAFGANAANANLALGVINAYHLTSQCFVTRPHAAMTYWLSGHHVPDHDTAFQDCNSVNPGNVQARNVNGSWKVVDGSSWLLDFGSDQASANQAVAVIQHYNMNRQCFVGRPNAPMQYWLSR